MLNGSVSYKMFRSGKASHLFFHEKKNIISLQMTDISYEMSCQSFTL